jgi:hypothetical protein
MWSKTTHCEYSKKYRPAACAALLALCLYKSLVWLARKSIKCARGFEADQRFDTRRRGDSNIGCLGRKCAGQACQLARIMFTKIWCGLLASQSKSAPVLKQTNDAMREGAVIPTEVASAANVAEELVTLLSLWPGC